MSTPHEIVTAPALARPVGYAHAVVTRGGRTVHLGGHTALDADGRIAGTAFVAQFDRAAENVVQALAAAGARPEHLVSMVLYVTDMAAYRAARRELREVWQRHFGSHYPALAAIGVRELYDPAALVELMGVAVVP